MQVSFPDVIDQHHGAEQIDRHLPEHIVQQAAACRLQPGRVPRHQLLTQQLRNGYAALGDQAADFGLALQLDHFIAEVVDTNPVFITVLNPVHLVVERRIEDGIEVKRPDMVFVVFVAVGVTVQDPVQYAGQHKILPFVDKILQLMPKRQRIHAHMDPSPHYAFCI